MAKVTTIIDRGKVKVARIEQKDSLDVLALFQYRYGEFQAIRGLVSMASSRLTDRERREEAMRLIQQFQYYWGDNERNTRKV